MAITPEQEIADLDVAALVRRAAGGDMTAWERLVEQYARLVWSITGEFKLVESDAADVAQATWLRLLEHIHRIKDPARLGSWLAVTARHECLRSMAARKKIVLVDDNRGWPDVPGHDHAVDEGILAEERARE